MNRNMKKLIHMAASNGIPLDSMTKERIQYLAQRWDVEPICIIQIEENGKLERVIACESELRSAKENN